MKALIKFMVILSFFFISQSCDKECKDKIVPVTNLENEYGCTDTQYQIQLSLHDVFIIIRNQEDFELQATGACQPEIDFSIYDLVIGKKGLTSGYNSIEYELKEKCESGDLELKVTFIQNSTMIAPVVVFNALVPKLGNEQLLNVNIIANN
jgi:hypothetical protein